MNGHDRIVRIKFSGEEHLDTERGQRGFKPVKLGRQLLFKGGIRAFFRQLQHGLKIAEFRLDLTPLDEFALKRDFFSAGRCG